MSRVDSPEMGALLSFHDLYVDVPSRQPRDTSPAEQKMVRRADSPEMGALS